MKKEKTLHSFVVDKVEDFSPSFISANADAIPHLFQVSLLGDLDVRAEKLPELFLYLMERIAKDTGDNDFLDKIPHDMRRTWATHAAQNGVSLWDIAGVLGDSPVVVANHYAHHCADHLRGAVDFRGGERGVIGALSA